MGVLVLQPLVIAVVKLQTHNSRLHQRSCCPNRQEIMHLLYPLCHLRTGDHIAQTPAGDRIRLGQRIADDRTLPHTRQRRHIGMGMWLVQNMLIHLIRDHKNIIPDRQLSDRQHFFPCKHFTTGIGRITQDQRLDPRLLYRRLQHIRIKGKCRRYERHIDRFSSA